MAIGWALVFLDLGTKVLDRCIYPSLIFFVGEKKFLFFSFIIRLIFFLV